MGRRNCIGKKSKGTKKHRQSGEVGEAIIASAGDIVEEVAEDRSAADVDSEQMVEEDVSTRHLKKMKDIVKSLRRSNTSKTKKLERIVSVVKDLTQQQKADHKGVAAMKSQVKHAKHNIHVEKKTSRLIIQQREDQHNHGMIEKTKEHKKQLEKMKIELEEAFAMVDEANTKAKNAEDACIGAEAEWKSQLRLERIRRCDELTRLKKEMTDDLQSARKKSIKDVAGMNAMLAHQNCVVQKRIDAIISMSEREVSVLKHELEQITADEQAKRELLEGVVLETRNKLNATRSGKRKAEASLSAAKSASERKSAELTTERESRISAQDKATEIGKKMASMAKGTDTSSCIPILVHINKRQLKKVRANANNGKPGGAMVYPQWVMAAICELLTCGSPPSSIRDTLSVMHRTFYGTEPSDIPSINYIRGGRLVLTVFNETMTAMKLAIAETWDQLCTDATTRRQIPFTALIIGLLGDDNIDQVIVSSCILTDDETSDAQAEGIIAKLQSLKTRLIRLAEVLEELYPGCSEELVPSPTGIDMKKLTKGGVITTDTCNTAQKLRRVLVERIKDLTDGNGEIFEFDCMNHLRNVWFGGMEKAVTKQLNDILRANLDDMDPKLRVTASLSAIIRAIDKEFSLSANYPKGHGQLFLEWIREYYPGVLLLHVERASGSRQDLCTEGAMAVFWNYPYYIEFLDTMLRKPPRNKNQEASILQQSLFVALSSEEMIALARLCSIMHISITIPFRWLAGKTHELAQYNWGPMNMAHAIQTLYHKMVELSKKPKLILDESFMMGIFAQYRTTNTNGLPPFAEYWDYLFSQKRTSVVARRSGTKEVPLFCLRDECFNPKRKTVKNTSPRTKELAQTAALAIIVELIHKDKATRKYIHFPTLPVEMNTTSKKQKKSKPPSKYSWEHCPQEMKNAMLGKAATNDIAESTLGGMTRQLQDYTTVHFSGAAAVNDTRRNNHFKTYHNADERLQEALFRVCIEDAGCTRELCNKALDSQAKARHDREKLILDVAGEKATEKYLEDMMYYRMYNTECCWKGNPNVVEINLRKIKTEASQLRAIKENITIRVKGMHKEWARHAWSEKGKLFTVDDLAEHLKFIICKENEEGNLPLPPCIKDYQLQRKKLPMLGKQVSEIAALNKKQMIVVNKFGRKVDAICKEREASREGSDSIYRKMQPWERPEVSDLVGRRIEMVYNVAKINQEEKKILRWCQGEVAEVVDGKKVCIIWDPIPDMDEFQDFTESDEELLPRLWNSAKTEEGAWRMDIDILLEGIDD